MFIYLTWYVPMYNRKHIDAKPDINTNTVFNALKTIRCVINVLSNVVGWLIAEVSYS